MQIETLTAVDWWELDRKINDFMHDKLIIDEKFFTRRSGVGVHIFYVELGNE